MTFERVTMNLAMWKTSSSTTTPGLSGTLVVDCGNWLPGKNVLVAPPWIHAVNWAERTVRVGLTRETIADSPEYTLAVPISPEYEQQLLNYYDKAEVTLTENH